MGVRAQLGPDGVGEARLDMVHDEGGEVEEAESDCREPTHNTRHGQPLHHHLQGEQGLGPPRHRLNVPRHDEGSSSEGGGCV